MGNCAGYCQTGGQTTSDEVNGNNPATFKVNQDSIEAAIKVNKQQEEKARAMITKATRNPD